ncbi:hypothetical protein EIN_504720 [Entamoeba invadens IP1]|uniref:Uncharacterized protein n=1 Tax=Entamoeba invadens IP1 TaxID=370355 RepID=A0A0A1U7C7_ENTIV|nr:hypothetical protein EIN_504720 [Entamoeba invadens IP1]ELP90296.1 hypothetical protein EIN_504720 [Entamoeba invadens IP1]|eukprot:XP_004257067.1 hypothetical protein EIN_504720 [Entamoeba invadens IP1]
MWGELDPPYHSAMAKSPKTTNYSVRRNYDVCVEVVLISLINKYAEVTILQPQGLNNAALPFVPIESIKFSESDQIEVNRIIDDRLNIKMTKEIQEGGTKEVASRKMKKERIPETLHFLIDILTELGTNVFLKMTRKKSGDASFDIVDSILYQNDNKEVRLDKEFILQKGTLLNMECITLVRRNRGKFVFEKNNETFRNILGI